MLYGVGVIRGAGARGVQEVGSGERAGGVRGAGRGDRAADVPGVEGGHHSGGVESAPENGAVVVHGGGGGEGAPTGAREGAAIRDMCAAVPEAAGDLGASVVSPGGNSLCKVYGNCHELAVRPHSRERDSVDEQHEQRIWFSCRTR